MLYNLSSRITTPEVSSVVIAENTAAQAAEKAEILKLIAKINEMIPPESTVLKSDILRIVKLIPYLIESANYNTGEYSFMCWVCTNYRFHILARIQLKTSPKTIIRIEGQYKYNNNVI